MPALLFQRTDKLPSALVRVDSAGRLHRLSWTVRIVSGPSAGRAVMLSRTLVVGSGDGVDLQLEDPAASRQHLELEPRADGVRVRDLGSTNGTFIGGARVDEAVVEAQAVVTVGRSMLAISVVDEPVDDIDGPTALDGLVGGSWAMRRLFGLVQRLAPTDTPAVLHGETGTGKEGLARALHNRSERRRGPFVTVDCGAIAPALIESELFGHARGAFTGAVAERPGAFLEAEGGTLFLDEIGELPLELQPRLLRVLEAKQIKRVGEDKHRAVDVRIVAATHKSLEAEVKAGRFRADLFFRLAVAVLRVPPLRERRDDLPALVKTLMAQLGRESFELSRELISTLATYDWPGNVRELRNVVARAVVSDAVSIDSVLNPGNAQAPGPASQPQPTPLDVPFKEAKERLVDNFTREYLRALLERHGGNVTQMAKASGLARTYLHDLLSKHGLSSQRTDTEK